MKLVSLLLIVFLAGCQSNSALSNSVGHSEPRPAADQDEFSARLFVKGMSCPLCANNIDKQLLSVPGVQKVSVDLGSGLVLVKLAPGNPPTKVQLETAIKQSGFTLDRIEMPEIKGNQP